jgi:protoporphyrinogen oxidase
MKKEITVIGGGISGVAAAYASLNNGNAVQIYEQEDKVGGMARSVQVAGGTFDRGPHGYHSDNKKIVHFIKRILGKNLLVYGKYVEIKYQDKYYRYPLKPFNVFWNMPLSLFLSSVSALLWVKIKYIFKKPVDRNAEDWLVNRFGRPLYQHFFKVYTEKVWGAKIKELSPEFPQHKIPVIRFSDIILRGLLNFGRSFGRQNRYAPVITTIYYPKHGGAGAFVEALSKEAQKKGCKIHNNVEVKKINVKNNLVESITVSNNGKEETKNVDEVISTIPITDLASILSPQIPLSQSDLSKLRYRALVVVCLVVNKNRVFKPQHYYYYDKTFSRLTEMKNWSWYLYPKGKTGLMAEITCEFNDSMWNANKKELCELVIKEIASENLIKHSDVIDYGIIRIKHAYPVYMNSYEKVLDRVKKQVSKIKNLHITGRQATFKYMNMDNCIEEAFILANNISKTEKNHYFL